MSAQLRDGLAPLADAIQQRRVMAHPISQVSLTLARKADAFPGAQREVLKWMNGRTGRPLPDVAWQGAAFELEDIASQHAEAVAIETPRFWAARLDDADKTVPSRTWVTEIALGQRSDGTTVFGAKLTAAVRGLDVPFERSIPGFVRQIVATVGAELDGRPVSESPWLVITEDDVDELVALLSNTARHVDVIVAALPEGSTNPSTAIVDVADIARRTLGAAHVAIISGPASFYLSDQVGKEFSVFHQAVRTYRPGFNVDLDEPFAHPLGLPQRIVAWPGGGAQAYSLFVVSQALTRSVSTIEPERLMPSFLTVKRTAAQIRLNQARQSGSSNSDLLALYEQDNQDLQQQLAQEREKNDALLTIAEAERDAAFDAAQQARKSVHHLKRRLESLQRTLATGSSKAAPIPTTLDGIQTWCEENLAGAVEMHSRAYRGLNDSEYEDVSLIYNALLLLRDHYIPMRREGEIPKVDAFRNACQALRLEEEPTGSETRAGEQGEEYYVRYGGRQVFLARHLKKGASRDPRRSFRLYFFWDEDSDQVVVGWLPSHLNSRIT